MSLVVAKRLNSEIYIVADTKLTYVDIDNHPEQTIAAPNEGVIKATLINPHVCICFAGDVDGVDDVLRVCRRARDFSRMLTILYSFHKSRNQRTEFIVAVSYHPLYRIIEIKGGKQTECESSWIGSKTGFSEFQKYFSVEANSGMSLDYKMGKALKMVMERSVDPTVNGFLITVSTTSLPFNGGRLLDWITARYSHQPPT